MTATEPLFLPFPMNGHQFRRLNFSHPEIEGRVLKEVAAGVPVYYDRLWPLTRRFCRFLLERPELVTGEDVLVVGAGAGMEAVVVGSLCNGLWVNDMAPGALELLGRQLEANGIEEYEVRPGSFGDVEVPESATLVVGSFVVYDRGSAGAMALLLERTAERGMPVLLADQNIGGHFLRLMKRQERPVRTLLEDDDARVVLIGA